MKDTVVDEETAKKETRTYRDFLPQSSQGSIDGGRYEPCINGQVINIDAEVPAGIKDEDVRIELRPVTLPKTWAGNEKWVSLRGSVFIIMPLLQRELRFKLLSGLRESGYIVAESETEDLKIVYLYLKKRMAALVKDKTDRVVVVTQRDCTGSRKWRKIVRQAAKFFMGCANVCVENIGDDLTGRLIRTIVSS